METDPGNPYANDPNYLILAIDERLRQIKDMTDRAGVMISVEALLATFIFLLHVNEPMSWGIKIYLIILPLVFVAISFFLHLSVFFKNSVLFPFEFLVKLARENRLGATPGTEIKTQLNETNKKFGRKVGAMNFGYSFFLLSFVLLMIVNLTSSTFIIEKFKTDGVIAFISLTLFIIGSLSAILIKGLLFKTKIVSLPVNIPLPGTAQVELSFVPIQQNNNANQDTTSSGKNPSS